MIAQLRERVGHWITGKRAAPITFAPEQSGMYYGTGLASNQPSHESLLRENIGVADIATRAIANRVATLNPQVKVSRQDSAGTLVDEVLDDHVLKELLDKPHEDFTRQQVLRLLTQYIVSTGEAYLLKINNRLGLPAMLKPMPSQHVDPIIKRALVDGYIVRDGKGQVHRLQKRDVIRIWFPDPETLYESEGYLGPNAVATDTMKFANEHLRSHYQYDATPPIMLKADIDSSMDPVELTRWQREYTGKYHNRSGTHRGIPAMLPHGWDAIQMALKSGADVAPLLEYFTANQLMNFGVPQSVLGRVVSGDRSSAETNQYVFDRHTVLPITQMIADALTLQLASDFDPELWIDFEEFVSDDKEYILKQEAQDLALKVRTGQQVIEDRGGDPERAPWADLPVGTIADTPYAGDDGGDGMIDDDPNALFEPEDEAEGEPAAKPSPAGSAGLGVAEDIQKSLLNGAQVASMISIVAQVQAGLLPRESGLQILEVAFGISSEEAVGIMAGAGNSPAPTAKKVWATAQRVSKGGSTPQARAAYFSPDAEWKRVLARERKFRPQFERALKYIFNQQRKEALRNLKEIAPNEDRARAQINVWDLFDPTKWDKLFEVRVDPIRTAAFVDSATGTMAAIGGPQSFQFTPTVAKRLSEYGGKMIDQVQATTAKRLQKALITGAEEGQSVGQIAKAVNEAFGGRRRNATTIARTELLRATQDAQIESFTQSGVVEYKRWNDNRDDDVRDSHFGSLILVVKTNQKFTLANGQTAAHPGDASLPAADSINCRCFVTPEFDDPDGLSE